jgi:hypothetical protein
MLFGFALTVVVRGVYWRWTWWFIGPVLGAVNLVPTEPSIVLFVAELLLTGLLGLATPVIGVGMVVRPGRFRQIGHALGWIFAIDTAAYLIVFLCLAGFELGWGADLLVPATAGNLGLAGIAVTVARWTQATVTTSSSSAT